MNTQLLFPGPRRPAATRLAIAASVLACAPAFAQVAPNLGSAGAFAVLGTNAIPTIGTVTCTGPGTINGQVGTTFAGGITNAPPCTINGPIVSPVGGGVVADFNAAFAAIPAQNPVCDGVIPIVTTTLAPGVYCSAAGTTIPAGVIITLNGNANDVWIFRVGTVGGALTLTGAEIRMAGSASGCNVYWHTQAAMTSTDSIFVGNVLSGSAVTMTRGSWFGRALATTDVTLTNPAPITGCALAGAGTTPVPTMSEWMLILLAGLLAVVGFAALRRRGS